MKKPLDKGGAVEEGVSAPCSPRMRCPVLHAPDVYKNPWEVYILFPVWSYFFSQIGRMMMTSKNRQEKPGKEM